METKNPHVKLTLRTEEPWQLSGARDKCNIEENFFFEDTRALWYCLNLTNFLRLVQKSYSNSMLTLDLIRETKISAKGAIHFKSHINE